MGSLGLVRAGSKACRLVGSFVGRYGCTPDALVAFSETEDPISTRCRDFANHVVQEVLRSERKELKSERTEDLPLFRIMPLRDLHTVENDLACGSWLYRVSDISFSVVFDEENIRSECRLRETHFSRAMTRLFLHELGHFVLHRDRLGNLEKSDVPTPMLPAVAEMEAEAWQFASTVIGIGVGSIAHFARERNHRDMSWLFW